MPKIEVNEEMFLKLAGFSSGECSQSELEDALVCAKAELDESGDKSLPPSERIIKIDLNDTNRPDLWSTAGAARQVRVYRGGKSTDYSSFFSSAEKRQTSKYKVIIKKSVEPVRPYMTGFVARGIEIDDSMLKDMIQTQEKLAWNYGRKRRSMSMGLYRTGIIKWPIIYKGVDPDSVSFVPLQWEEPLTPREILKQHPKGKEFAFILEHEKVHPLLLDSQDQILSYPPIINSADLGAVQVGDSEIFVELTGTDKKAVTLAASIMACDLADYGFKIEPVELEYDFDTPFGRKCITPYYFQEPVFCSLKRVEKFTGVKLSADECLAALTKMGVKAEMALDKERSSAGEKSEGIWAYPPVYRNDYLHAVDVAEDIIIGCSLDRFTPERPSDFTVGRLTPLTLFGREVRELMVGLGYQEMIYNYLGSGKDFIEKMRSSGETIVRISNPMTENYEYVRDGIIASLLASESVSGHSAYPHKLFEIGKVTYWEKEKKADPRTRHYLGFLNADKDANFNTIAAQIQTLFYYLSREYEVEEREDPRFIKGRCAAILYKGDCIGVFGEIHPEVLENWGIGMPCTAAELDMEALL